MKIKLKIQNRTQAKNIPSSKKMQLWANAALKKNSTNQLLGIRLVNRRESAQLNEKYRNKTGPTNVLSFSYQFPNYLGDLVLCVPLVAQEAKQQKKSSEAHWAHLIIHGVLHLLGYDHQKTSEAKKMEKLETDILGKLGYPDPYMYKDIYE